MASSAKQRGRSRIRQAIGITLVIAIGLASRRFPLLLPAILDKYPGDALWALMVFLGWGMVLPHGSTRRIALIALATLLCVELSQLYQTAWINRIRDTTLGHLVLGSTFSWGDLLAYAVGIAFGCVIEQLLSLWRNCQDASDVARRPRHAGP